MDAHLRATPPHRPYGPQKLNGLSKVDKSR